MTNDALPAEQFLSRYVLIRRAVEQHELPETFAFDHAFAWLEERYPGKYQPRPLQRLLREMCANVRLAQRPGQVPQVLFRVGPATYTQYRPEIHGPWKDGVQGPTGPDDVEDESGEEAAANFVFEKHLEDFMEANWAHLDFGAPLRLYTDELGTSGRQYPTDIGPIDFLCVDSETGDFWVLELKRGKSSDRVVGQILRYMGWVKKHLAAEKNVRGLVITHEANDQLKYALLVAENVRVWTYAVSFTFNRETVAL